jgi:hypothetical protein
VSSVLVTIQRYGEVGEQVKQVRDPGRIVKLAHWSMAFSILPVISA